MSSDYTAYINGTEIDTGDGLVTAPGELSIKCAWPDVFIDLSYGDVVNYDPKGVSSYNADGMHKVATLKPGNWIVRVAKGSSKGRRGFYFPLVIAAAAAKPLKRLRAFISDVGTVAANFREASTAGFNAVREWVGWAATGVSADKISRLNAFVTLGMGVIATLTPKMNLAAPEFPEAAIQQIIRDCDKRVVWQIINECNLNGRTADGKPEWYWPWGDRASAFAMAAKISARLREAGFTVISPSFTGGTKDQLAGWYREAIDQLGGWPFDLTDIHLYPDFDPNWDGTPIATINGYLDAAQTPGVPVVSTEWGFNFTWTDRTKPEHYAAKTDAQTIIGKALPVWREIFDRRTTMDANFIFTRTNDPVNKPNHDRFPWCVDLSAGVNGRTPFFAMFQAANLQSLNRAA